jgi:phage anti-repressor protein
MKRVSINKVKVNIFEPEELIEKLGLSQKETNLILAYQREFPELLQDDVEGFVIDGEKLCNQLGVKEDFTKWLLAKTRLDSKGNIKWQGKLEKYKCAENVDYVTEWDSPDARFSKDDIDNMAPQQRSAYKIKTKISLTLECAKKIAMRQNNDKGDLVVDYFILMEKTLRNYESWIGTRKPEKSEWNNMAEELKIWCSNRGYDMDLFGSFRSREANMINKSILNLTASEIKNHIGYRDNITRNHLEERVNSAILEMELLNTRLLIADMDFEERKRIIESNCKRKYSELYIVNK